MTDWIPKMKQQRLDGLTNAKLDYIHNGADNHISGNISLSFCNCEGGQYCIDLEDYAYGTIRISLGKDNTEEDMESIVRALNKIIIGQKKVRTTKCELKFTFLLSR